MGLWVLMDWQKTGPGWAKMGRAAAQSTARTTAALELLAVKKNCHDPNSGAVDLIFVFNCSCDLKSQECNLCEEYFD